MWVLTKFFHYCWNIYNEIREIETLLFHFRSFHKLTSLQEVSKLLTDVVSFHDVAALFLENASSNKSNLNIFVPLSARSLSWPHCTRSQSWLQWVWVVFLEIIMKTKKCFASVPFFSRCWCLSSKTKSLNQCLDWTKSENKENFNSNIFLFYEIFTWIPVSKPRLTSLVAGKLVTWAMFRFFRCTKPLSSDKWHGNSFMSLWTELKNVRTSEWVLGDTANSV